MSRDFRRDAPSLAARAALGALYAPEPRVKAVLLAIEGTAWLAEYPPEIRSYYLDGPKTLTELQTGGQEAPRGRPGTRTCGDRMECQVWVRCDRR